MEETSMKLNRKDRKIQIQQNIINRLEEENRTLKEQLEAFDPEKAIKRMKAAEELYQEYTDMLEEVREMQKEYVELIEEMVEMKEEMKRKCK